MRSLPRRHFVTCALLLAATGCQPTGQSDDGVQLNPAVEPLSVDIDTDARTAIGARYVVQFRDAARGAAQLAAAGAEVALALPQHDAVAAYIPAGAVRGLQQSPNVVLIELDPIRKPMSESVPYGIPMVQADQVTEAAGTGPVTVCIIDSGYYDSHEDLAANPNVTFSTDNGTGNARIDGCGHGTHVAGTIAAVGGNDVGVVGVNPGGRLKLHIVKVFGDDCAWAYSSSLVKAVDECRANAGGKLVMSMSLGGSTKSVFEESAFHSAYNAGALSVAAAGNDGNNRKSYPASYSSVISVAAIDSAKKVASFSQYNSEVELAAPGVSVKSTVPWYTNASISVGGSTYAGSSFENSAQTTALGIAGTLVDGGLCTSTVSGAGGKIVRCARGDITFYDKVVNAVAGGAIGVVISNNVSGGFSGTLGAGNSASVPVIAISLEDGAALAPSYGQSATLVSMITKPASGYESWDGTSMATPHVSGVAALVWNNAPTATNAQLRAALDSTAEDLGVAGRDTSYGYGLVRAKAALDNLLGSGGGNTCTPTQSSESSCSDGIDNDCDGLTDSADPNCQTSTCQLGQVGASCTLNSDCCSNTCKGKTGAKTCK